MSSDHQSTSIKPLLWLPELAIVAGAWIFGSAGVFVKSLDMPATVLAGFRLFVPGVVLLLLAGELRRRVFSELHPQLMLASCLTVFRILLWVLGLSWAPMSKAVVVLFSWPVLFALISVLLGQEKMTLNKVFLLGLSILGLLLMQNGSVWSWDSRESLGLLCMFASALLFACNMFIYKQALTTAPPMEVVLRDCLVGGVVYLPFMLYHGSEFSVLQLSGAAGYSLLVGLVGYGMVYYGLARLKASTASVLAYNEVVSAGVFGFLIFSERWGAQSWLGAACILLAAALVRRQR